MRVCVAYIEYKVKAVVDQVGAVDHCLTGV